jgi:DAACS family dicarboxylate/amino acid:cation (Na+ or H+) symporter
LTQDSLKSAVNPEFGNIRGIFYTNVIAIAVGLAVALNSKLISPALMEVFSDLAMLPVTLIKGFAGPLLFLAICLGFMSDQPVLPGVKKLIVICLRNACFAVLIALLLVNILKPGLHLTDLAASLAGAGSAGAGVVSKSVGWRDAIRSIAPESILSPFINNNIPAILTLAILFGVGARLQGQSESGWQPWFLKLREGIEVGLGVISKILLLILKLMPMAICAAVAKAVSSHGVGVFKGLSWYVAVTVSGMLLQVVLVYHALIWRRARRSITEFWKYAKLPVLYAFGVNSSLSALPATLSSLDQLGCSKASAHLGACVGTNFNNDGILLYEVAAVLMLAQGFGLDWSLADQVGVAFLCVIATLGVSGFPEAGIVALSLVLPMAGLPVELIPLLLPVDWFVARCRSATNVVSDMTVSLAIDGPKMDSVR